MYGARVVREACILVPLLALAVGAPAGAQCLDGTRPLISRERAFYKNTLTALRAAMPEPPAGWRIADQSDVRAPRGICIGSERQPLSLRFFVDLEPVAASGTLPEVVPVSDGARPAHKARILVTVNPKQVRFDPHADRLVVSGVTLALSDTADEAGRTSLGLLIGDWSLFRPDDPSQSLEAWAHFDTEVVYTGVQSISVRLDGPSAPVTDLATRLDVERLKTLLPKDQSQQ